MAKQVFIVLSDDGQLTYQYQECTPAEVIMLCELAKQWAFRDLVLAECKPNKDEALRNLVQALKAENGAPVGA